MAKKKQDAAWSARMFPPGTPAEAKGDEAFKVDPLGETLVNHPNVPPIVNSSEGIPLSGEYSDKEYYEAPGWLHGARSCMLCGLETPPVIKNHQGAALSLFRKGILTWSETKDSIGPMSEPLKDHIRTGTHPDCARLYFGASNGLGSAGMDFIKRNVKPPEHQMNTMWDDTPREPEVRVRPATSDDTKYSTNRYEANDRRDVAAWVKRNMRVNRLDRKQSSKYRIVKNNPEAD